MRSGQEEGGADGFRRWAGLVNRWALLIVASALIVSGLAATYLAGNLAIDTDTENMIDPSVPFRADALEFKRAFPRSEGLLLIVVDGPSPEEAEMAAAVLAERLSGEAALFSRVERPDGLAFFRRNGLLFRSEAELSALADRMAAASPLLATLAADSSLAGLAEILSQALAAPETLAGADLERTLAAMAAAVDRERLGEPGALSWRRLMAAPDAEVTPGSGLDTRRFILSYPVLEFDRLQPAGKAIAAVREAEEALGFTPNNGYRVRLSGKIALNHEELESVKAGGQFAGLLSLTAVALLLILGLRSLRLMAAVLATLVMGLVWTAAFAALTVGSLNLISVAFAVLFVGLGVDFGIHFALRYREERGRAEAKADALASTHRGVAGALALAALCAAAGFFSFLPTDYRGLAELGLIAGGGMAIALLLNLSVLPALLVLFGVGPAKQRMDGLAASRERLLRWRWPIAGAAAVTALGGLLLLPRLEFDMNPLNLKDPDSESVEVFLELTRQPATSPYTIDVLAADLDAARVKAARLADLPAVARAVTLESFVPENQEDKLFIIDDMAFLLGPLLNPPEPTPPPDGAGRVAALEDIMSALGESAQPGAERLRAALTAFEAEPGFSPETTLGLQHRLLDSLDYTLGDLRQALMAGPVALEDLPDALRERWIAEDGRARIEVAPAGGIADNEALRAFARAVKAVEPAATGTPVVITRAGEVVVEAFVEASFYALAAILVLLGALLRRPQDVLFVLIPLTLAGGWTVAASVLLDLPFNFANVIVLPLLLGLGVASGIHLVVRRRKDPRSGHLLATSTPRAVLYSALTTIASFGSLAVSGHRGMTSMGQLLTIAIVFVLIATLVVLPALMARPPRTRRDATKE